MRSGHNIGTAAIRIDAGPQLGQEDSDALLALFVDVLARNWRALPANPLALKANGFEVRVVDRPGEEQIPGVMVMRLRIQELGKSDFDVLVCKPRMRLGRLTVGPSEERDDARCRCNDDCPKTQP